MKLQANFSNYPLTGWRLTLRIISVTVFTLACYTIIGLPLAVLPIFVHKNLAFSTVIAGAAVSLQYIATLASRPFAGRLSDRLGAKSTVCRGLIFGGVSGIFLTLGFLISGIAWLSLLLLGLSRLALGVGESLVGTGAILWGIGLVGNERNTQVISWNGVATYGGLALGAPLGVLLFNWGGAVSIGITVILLAIVAYSLARKVTAAPIIHGEKMPYHHVILKVLPYGTGLALASVGFGAISAFITLYYAAQHWPHAALSLSLFGLVFIVIRLLFSQSIQKMGGLKVAIVSLIIEVIGLSTLWLAPSYPIALIGTALTGMGFSLIYPALGVVAVQCIPDSSRGAALSIYTVFMDIAMGITGPVAGYIAGTLGYSAIFLYAAGAAVAGLSIALVLFIAAKQAVKVVS